VKRRALRGLGGRRVEVLTPETEADAARLASAAAAGEADGRASFGDGRPLRKARRGMVLGRRGRLVPEKRTVTRGGRTFQQTVWVRPGERPKAPATAAAVARAIEPVVAEVKRMAPKWLAFRQQGEPAWGGKRKKETAAGLARSAMHDWDIGKQVTAILRKRPRLAAAFFNDMEGVNRELKRQTGLAMDYARFGEIDLLDTMKAAAASGESLAGFRAQAKGLGERYDKGRIIDNPRYDRGLRWVATMHDPTSTTEEIQHAMLAQWERGGLGANAVTHQIVQSAFAGKPVRDAGIPDVMVEKAKHAVLDLYRRTQDALRARGEKKIRLYRGVQTMAGGNILESWTPDEEMATFFANIGKFKGKVRRGNIPAARVLATYDTPPGEGILRDNEQEYMVLTKRPDAFGKSMAWILEKARAGLVQREVQVKGRRRFYFAKRWVKVGPEEDDLEPMALSTMPKPVGYITPSGNVRRLSKAGRYGWGKASRAQLERWRDVITGKAAPETEAERLGRREYEAGEYGGTPPGYEHKHGKMPDGSPPPGDGSRATPERMLAECPKIGEALRNMAGPWDYLGSHGDQRMFFDAYSGKDAVPVEYQDRFCQDYEFAFKTWRAAAPDGSPRRGIPTPHELVSKLPGVKGVLGRLKGAQVKKAAKWLWDHLASVAWGSFVKGVKTVTEAQRAQADAWIAAFKDPEGMGISYAGARALALYSDACHREAEAQSYTKQRTKRLVAGMKNAEGYDFAGRQITPKEAKGIDAMLGRIRGLVPSANRLATAWQLRVNVIALGSIKGPTGQGVAGQYWPDLGPEDAAGEPETWRKRGVKSRELDLDYKHTYAVAHELMHSWDDAAKKGIAVDPGAGAPKARGSIGWKFRELMGDAMVENGTLARWYRFGTDAAIPTTANEREYRDASDKLAYAVGEPEASITAQLVRFTHTKHGSRVKTLDAVSKAFRKAATEAGLTESESGVFWKDVRHTWEARRSPFARLVRTKYGTRKETVYETLQREKNSGAYLCSTAEYTARFFEQYAAWKHRGKEIDGPAGFLKWERYLRRSHYFTEAEFKALLPHFKAACRERMGEKFLKSLLRRLTLLLKGKGFPVGTIRKMAGLWHKKLPTGKWWPLKKDEVKAHEAMLKEKGLLKPGEEQKPRRRKKKGEAQDKAPPPPPGPVGEMAAAIVKNNPSAGRIKPTPGATSQNYAVPYDYGQLLAEYTKDDPDLAASVLNDLEGTMRAIAQASGGVSPPNSGAFAALLNRITDSNLQAMLLAAHKGGKSLAGLRAKMPAYAKLTGNKEWDLQRREWATWPDPMSSRQDVHYAMLGAWGSSSGKPGAVLLQQTVGEVLLGRKPFIWQHLVAKKGKGGKFPIHPKVRETAKDAVRWLYAQTQRRLKEVDDIKTLQDLDYRGKDAAALMDAVGAELTRDMPPGDAKTKRLEIYAEVAKSLPREYPTFFVSEQNTVQVMQAIVAIAAEPLKAAGLDQPYGIEVTVRNALRKAMKGTAAKAGSKDRLVLFRGVKAPTVARNAVESWTRRKSTADSFDHHKVFREEVPLSQILAFPKTDSKLAANEGKYGEDEFLLLATPPLEHLATQAKEAHS